MNLVWSGISFCVRLSKWQNPTKSQSENEKKTERKKRMDHFQLQGGAVEIPIMRREPVRSSFRRSSRRRPTSQASRRARSGARAGAPGRTCRDGTPNGSGGAAAMFPATYLAPSKGIPCLLLTRHRCNPATTFANCYSFHTSR